MVEPTPIKPGSKYGIILPGSRSFPGGNDTEFPEIREELRKRGITWYEREVNNNSTAFWLYGSEVPKLPEDKDNITEDNSYLNYIGSEDYGHGISNLDNFLVRHPGVDICCPKYGELILLGTCKCGKEIIVYFPYELASHSPITTSNTHGCGSQITVTVELQKTKQDGSEYWVNKVHHFEILS